MAVAPPLRLVPEWDGRFTRMLGVSALAHALLIAAVIVVAERSVPVSLPEVVYTVQLTDPNALGGRVPAGAPGRDHAGGSTVAPSPPPKGEPPAAAPEAQAKVEPAAPPEPKVEPPPATVPPPPKAPEAKPPEPAPVVKQAPPKPEPKPVAKPEPKPVAKPGGAAATHGQKTGDENAPPRDAYAALAERWKTHPGGGLGGPEGGTGPIGAGGDGKGGGGQLVGIEFLAYRQRVINTVKERWSNVIARPGLVVAVRFAIAPDGTLSDIRISQPSGNTAYDTSAVRAVQHASPLPAPPAKYAREFEEFEMKFESEERGGGGAG